MNITEQEPVLSAAAIAGAIGALLVALVSLGVLDLTPEQSAAIMAAVVAILPIATSLWARERVTPLANARDTDGEALTRYDGMPPIAEQQAMGLTPKPVPDRGDR